MDIVNKVSWSFEQPSCLSTYIVAGPGSNPSDGKVFSIKNSGVELS